MAHFISLLFVLVGFGFSYMFVVVVFSCCCLIFFSVVYVTGQN